MSAMRLQRFLAQAGIASRRASEELILAGTVRVNGKIVRVLGTSVEPTDVVEYGGNRITLAVEKTYVVMHKPFGVMTTLSDPEGRKTIADVLKTGGVTQRVVPVGRLDYDTAGLLLLTDDGDLAHVLTHPRYGVEKTYRATIKGRLAPDALARISAGLRLDDGRTAPAKLRVVLTNRMISQVDISLHEGRNRQVRRMFEAVGSPLEALVRLKFGPLTLGDLPPGAMREPTERELRELRLVLTYSRDQDAMMAEEDAASAEDEDE
jgi:23S rRNA pseudouridine2605 synthase